MTRHCIVLTPRSRSCVDNNLTAVSVIVFVILDDVFQVGVAVRESVTEERLLLCKYLLLLELIGIAFVWVNTLRLGWFHLLLGD